VLSIIGILCAFLLGAALGWSWNQNRWRRELARLEVLARSVAQGETPKSFVFLADPSLQALAVQLERIFLLQQELARTQAYKQEGLRAILETMTEGVLVVDAKGSISLANRAFMTHFGLAENPVGRTILEILPFPEIAALLNETVAEGKPHSRELRVDRALGRAGVQYFAVNATPFFRGGSAAGEAVIVFHNITRQKDLEAARRELVANISHELRTPLSVLSGYLETLVEGPPLPSVQKGKVLEIMRRHCQRLTKLVNDLLTLWRAESRELPLELEELDLASVLSQSLLDLAQGLEKKELRVNLDLPPELPSLRADRFRLEQILYNLLDNAVKYSPPKGEIHIGARSSPQSLLLHIKDQGPGIPPEHLPRIFERFYRVESSRSREEGGTGLGLAIVKHLVALHGGRVWAESKVGEGTTLYVELPILGPESPKPQGHQ
jgi:two-component system phosphate regulon sensor histidine kinase PhoR